MHAASRAHTARNGCSARWSPAISAVLIGPRTEEQLADLLAGADVDLDADALDAIDEIVPPGTVLNPADAGWTAPGLTSTARLRH